jgi:hypothetical protein
MFYNRHEEVAVLMLGNKRKEVWLELCQLGRRRKRSSKADGAGRGD